MKDIVPILRSLGLLESEIKTYLAAIEKGPQTVLDLTKQTGLSRQATYVAIGSLTERGLMSSVMRVKKRFYTAEHPSRLLAYAKRRQSEMDTRVKDLERSLPELELQMGGERPVVKVLEGKEGVHAMMLDMMTVKPSVSYEITDLNAMQAILTSEDRRPLLEETRRGGIHIVGIYGGNPRPPSVDSVDQYVLPPERWGFKTNISIYANKVALITFEERMYTIMIENRAIANTLRHLFEIAIGCLPIYKKYRAKE